MDTDCASNTQRYGSIVQVAFQNLSPTCWISSELENDVSTRLQNG